LNNMAFNRTRKPTGDQPLALHARVEKLYLPGPRIEVHNKAFLLFNNRIFPTYLQSAKRHLLVHSNLLSRSLNPTQQQHSSRCSSPSTPWSLLLPSQLFVLPLRKKRLVLPPPTALAASHMVITVRYLHYPSLQFHAISPSTDWSP